MQATIVTRGYGRPLLGAEDALAARMEIAGALEAERDQRADDLIRRETGPPR